MGTMYLSMFSLMLVHSNKEITLGFRRMWVGILGFTTFIDKITRTLKEFAL